MTENEIKAAVKKAYLEGFVDGWDELNQWAGMDRDPYKPAILCWPHSVAMAELIAKREPLTLEVEPK